MSPAALMLLEGGWGDFCADDLAVYFLVVGGFDLGFVLVDLV